VRKAPYIGRRSGEADYVSFPLDDGTGRVLVVAHGGVARSMVKERLPERGERLRVTGSLSTSADRQVRLRLLAPDQLVWMDTVNAAPPPGEQ